MLQERILNVWKNYAMGQLLGTAFVAVTTCGAGALTGLRFALINGIIAGICENIPNIGPIISGVISALLAVIFGSSRLDLANWQFMLVIIGCCLIIQLLQNWLISPLIIGKKLDLNPIIVILGMTVFSMLFGFWGMILAVPIIGTIREIYRYYKPDLDNRPSEDKLEPPNNK